MNPYPKPVCVFTAAEARLWGWTVQEGDKFLSKDDTWQPHKAGDSFEVEPINSRPWEVVIGQLVVNQSLANEVERLRLEVQQMRKEQQVTREVVDILDRRMVAV